MLRVEEVDHVGGTIVNELVVHPPDQLDLWEEKRRYDARFQNRFDTKGYVRRQMGRLQLQPVKAEAESRAARRRERRR